MIMKLNVQNHHRFCFWNCWSSFKTPAAHFVVQFWNSIIMKLNVQNHHQFCFWYKHSFKLSLVLLSPPITWNRGFLLRICIALWEIMQPFIFKSEKSRFWCIHIFPSFNFLIIWGTYVNALKTVSLRIAVFI